MTKRKHNDTVIDIDDLNEVLFCAFRYALGRKTYITAVISEILIRNISKLTKNHRQLIADDINYAFDTNNYGMEMDKDEWLKVLDAIADYSEVT